MMAFIIYIRECLSYNKHNLIKLIIMRFLAVMLIFLPLSKKVLDEKTVRKRQEQNSLK